MFSRLVVRDIRRAWGGGRSWLPVAFLLMVAAFFPFALGSDPRLLRRVGPGLLWTAALLAALLPVEGLIAPDAADGTLDQLRLHGAGEETVAAAKLLGHWLGWAPPLLAAAAMGALLFGLSALETTRLLASLTLGTPALAALAVAVAALTAGLPGAGALGPLLLLPLGVPILIFGAGAAAGEAGAFALLGATSLLAIAVAPWAAGAAIREGRG